jgi:signal transduction histidine kinase
VIELGGDSRQLLRRLGRRYAIALRLVILLPLASIALLRAEPERLVATAVTVTVAVGWTCAYCRLLAGTTRSYPVVVDVVVLLAVGLSVFVTDAVEHQNAGWLRLLVTFAAVSWQWCTPPVVGALATLAVGGGMVAIVATAGTDTQLVVSMAWVPVAAALSRAGWTIVGRAANRADHAAAEAERERRKSVVAAAVRAEERDLATTLHDTAATTLLMVGTGQVPRDADWLAAQARRDLDRLRSRQDRTPRRGDLVALLRDDAEATRLTIELDTPSRLELPFGVARALADATAEALTNVRRHAGTDRATVTLTGDASRLRLEIADDGRGFRAADVPATRRGLSESVRGRVRRIGGTATVTSAPGAGTVVRLDWGEADG